MGNRTRSANDRLFHVGRLDTDTEGLLILTNDGEFGHRLAHPSFEVPKTYLAEVDGVVNPHTLRAAAPGRHARGRSGPPDVGQGGLDAPARRLWSGSRCTEGRNRIVRRTMEAVGHPVRRLSRTGIGPVRLGNLKVGEFRELTRDELGALLDLTSS